MGFSALAAFSALSAVGSVVQGIQARNQSNLQASLLERQAARENQLAQQEADTFARRSRALIGTSIARQGGSGTRVGTGTSLLVDEDTAAEAEFQRLNILSGGQATAANLRGQGRFERSRGQSEFQSGLFGAGRKIGFRTASLLRGSCTNFGRG